MACSSVIDRPWAQATLVKSSPRERCTPHEIQAVFSEELAVDVTRSLFRHAGFAQTLDEGSFSQRKPFRIP